MNADLCWQLFLRTGSPEAYLLFKNQRRMEQSYVFENTGAGAPCHDVQ